MARKRSKRAQNKKTPAATKVTPTAEEKTVLDIQEYSEEEQAQAFTAGTAVESINNAVSTWWEKDINGEWTTSREAPTSAADVGRIFEEVSRITIEDLAVGTLKRIVAMVEMDDDGSVEDESTLPKRRRELLVRLEAASILAVETSEEDEKAPSASTGSNLPDNASDSTTERDDAAVDAAGGHDPESDADGSIIDVATPRSGGLDDDDDDDEESSLSELSSAVPTLEEFYVYNAGPVGEADLDQLAVMTKGDRRGIVRAEVKSYGSNVSTAFKRTALIRAGHRAVGNVVAVNKAYSTLVAPVTKKAKLKPILKNKPKMMTEIPRFKVPHEILEIAAPQPQRVTTKKAPSRTPPATASWGGLPPPRKVKFGGNLDPSAAAWAHEHMAVAEELTRTPGTLYEEDQFGTSQPAPSFPATKRRRKSKLPSAAKKKSKGRKKKAKRHKRRLDRHDLSFSDSDSDPSSSSSSSSTFSSSSSSGNGRGGRRSSRSRRLTDPNLPFASEAVPGPSSWNKATVGSILAHERQIMAEVARWRRKDKSAGNYVNLKHRQDPAGREFLTPHTLQMITMQTWTGTLQAYTRNSKVYREATNALKRNAEEMLLISIRLDILMSADFRSPTRDRRGRRVFEIPPATLTVLADSLEIDLRRFSCLQVQSELTLKGSGKKSTLDDWGTAKLLESSLTRNRESLVDTAELRRAHQGNKLNKDLLLKGGKGSE
jgi:hypothetical protein